MNSIKIYVVLLLLTGSLRVSAQTDDTPASIVTKASEQSKKPYYMGLTARKDPLPLYTAADSLARATGNIPARAVINEGMGFCYYLKDADKCIKYYLAAYDLFNEAGIKMRSAQCLHNIAFAYEEQKSNTPEALKYTKLAIQARTELKDTLSMANMLKYAGYLEGKLHDFTIAKKDVAEAVRMYTLKKSMAGAAVSYHDLALIYDEEHKPDSCIASIVHAKNIWMSDTKSDTSRIFNANNIMLRVYTSQNNLHDAEAVFGENNAMVNSDAMQDTRRAYMDILDFYKNSAAYFGKKSDPKTAEEYNAKYNAYKNELQQHGYHLEGY